MKIYSINNIYNPNNNLISFSRKKEDEIFDEELSSKELLNDIGQSLQAMNKKYEILKNRFENDSAYNNEEVRRNPLDVGLDEILLLPGRNKYWRFRHTLSDDDCTNKQATRIIEHLGSLKPDERVSVIGRIIEYAVDKEDLKTLYLISNYCNELIDKSKKVSSNPPVYKRVLPDSIYAGIVDAAINLDVLNAIKPKTFDRLSDNIQNKIISHAYKNADTNWIEDNFWAFSDKREERMTDYIDLFLQNKTNKRMDLDLVHDYVYLTKNHVNRRSEKFLQRIIEQMNQYVPVENEEIKLHKKIMANVSEQLSWQNTV